MAEILKNKGAKAHRILAIMVGLEGENPLQLVEVAGRTAYQSRDRITDDSAAKFVEMIRKRGHEAVLEHSAMTIEFNNVSRGFTHELVRHRLASYTQESTRYVDESNLKVVIPPDKEPNEKLVELQLPNGIKLKVSFQDWIDLNEQMYRGLRKAGWVPQDARQILPIGIKSQIVMTANFREWRHVFKLRTAPDAHWEIRQVMTNLLKEVKEKIPIIFNDIL
ncbi:thymidylate synthase (FAD) [bacterium (Candidatus Gribaldobacteria) CG_4_10_14_0_2_um_filter_33_15]|nr:MAG: thymidylate synthase (FAD) [bacterium (Candidatus Gribaldobacteria) CG_4_10_14_0_2_um_filter_33_15]